MPTPLLFVLAVLIGAYVALAGAASVASLVKQLQDPPPPPSGWPTVTVVVPARDGTDDDLLQQIRECEYPTDRLDVLVPAAGPTPPSTSTSDDVAVRSVSGPKSDAPSRIETVPTDPVLEAAEGDIVLTMPPTGTPSTGWIRSMAQHCTPDTPVVVGPTIVDHEDLFLPRLQALSHLGGLAWTSGASHLGIPAPVDASNRAVCAETIANDASPPSGPIAPTATLNLDPDALATRPPVNSFEALLRRLAAGFRRAGRSPSWLVQAQGIGLWLLHAVLLACALVAVVIPSWRQPTLLALVGKMGADVVLTLPIAKHYDQRDLFRSLVPTELMLLLALPVAGVWSLVSPSTNTPTH